MVQDLSTNGHHPVEPQTIADLNKGVNYPGAGVTAAVETFEAFKLFHEKFNRLDPEQSREYQKLVLDWNTANHLEKYHARFPFPTNDLNVEEAGDGSGE